MSESLTAPSGAVGGAPLLLLRLESVGLGIGAIVAYWYLGQSWWLFAVLFLAPDLSIIGYLANARVGAAIYNAVHTLIGPLGLIALGSFSRETTITGLGLIWIAHIEMDRALGFGLKYSSAFAHTHLGKSPAQPGISEQNLN